MERKQFGEKAQMMTLEALIASLLIIASVLFVVSQVPPQAQQGDRFSEVQISHYGEDILKMLKKSPSPPEDYDKDYDNLLQYYIGENDYGELQALLESSLPDNIGYSVALVSPNETEELFSNGYPGSEQVVVSEIVVSKNVALGGIGGAAAEVRKVEKTFPAGSLIIPMDDPSDTETGQNNILKAMGLIYNVTNGTYSDGESISVWEILQDPRGESVNFFKTNITTSTDPSNTSEDINNRYYAGGPYLIDDADLTPEIRQRIINASNIESAVTVHQVVEKFTYPFTIELKFAPKIAAYPPNNPDGLYMSDLNATIWKYYQHSGVPVTVIDDHMILNGDLDDFDILTIPHANLTPMNDSITEKLIDWVSNGGVIHAECLSITTLDDRVENVDGNSHSWHGFIGVSNGVSYNSDRYNSDTGLYYDLGRSMIFVGNDSLAYDDDSLAYDNSSSYGDYANPGSCFDVLSQSGDKNGRLPQSPAAYVPSLKLIQYPNNTINYQEINPDLTILAGAGFLNTNEYSNIDYNNITYVSAPFDKGLVTYLAGHDMSVDDGGSTSTPHKERLMFQTFFYPGFAKIYDYGVVELQITLWYK